MAEETKNSQYLSYPMFKGLQKPLEFMGIQGRYITWAAIAVGGAILGFIIAYCISSSRRRDCTPRRKTVECSSMPTQRRCNLLKFKFKQMSKCVEI